jgi:hypothetical protein
MGKHIGHDHSCHNRFHIVELDPAARTVVIRYEENEWTQGTEQTRQLDWIEFLEGLMDGRFEIRPTALAPSES